MRKISKLGRGLSKLGQQTKRTLNKVIDPDKEKREARNAKLRKKYANDVEFRKKCEARRIALKEKRKLEREKKLSKIKIEKTRCFFCCRKDKKIDMHHPDYTKPKFVIPLCRKCHLRLHALKRMEKELK